MSKRSTSDYWESRLNAVKSATTEWTSISQLESDVFAALTGDRALMHNDPEWAAGSPWGGTIVHGYHVLAMLPRALDALQLPGMDDDRNYALNYGLNRVRIIRPMRVGAAFRFTTTIVDIEHKGNLCFLVSFEHVVEVRGEDQPFMVAESLAYCAFEQELTAASAEQGR